MKYSIVIQWSDEDQAYVVSLPEFGSYAHTHGDTYQEALENAQDVLASLVEQHQRLGRSLPEPQQYSDKRQVA
jgi:antitoxin HicB